MSLIVIVWSVLCLIFLGVPSAFFLYLCRAASKPWRVKINRAYNPFVTIIIPTHNEEKTIGFKLENLCKVEYPKEKMQIILIDDASTDETIEKASIFINNHPELNIEIIRESERKGKSRALNLALNHAKYDVVIVSDSDTFWAPDILIEALPYLADPSVGAISGRQRILNSEQSWVTRTEKIYLDLMYEVVKLGESKIHSTIMYHGLFSAYKRDFLKEFNLETDDSGTALDIVQRGARALYIPEATCFEISPTTWKARFSTKVRRVSQLVQIYAKCLKLLVKNQLSLPKKIVIPEIFLYLLNPIIFFLLMFTTYFLIFEYWPYSAVLPLILSLIIVAPKTRLLFVELIQTNCILLGALVASRFKKKFITWDTGVESRSLLSREALEKENLI